MGPKGGLQALNGGVRLNPVCCERGNQTRHNHDDGIDQRCGSHLAIWATPCDCGRRCAQLWVGGGVVEWVEEEVVVVVVEPPG